MSTVYLSMSNGQFLDVQSDDAATLVAAIEGHIADGTPIPFDTPETTRVINPRHVMWTEVTG